MKSIILFIFIIIVLFPSTVSSSFLLAENEHARLARTIVIMNPKLSIMKSEKLAKAFLNVSSTCGIQWYILASIAYNESTFNITAVNHKSKDFGLMQINERNIKKFNLSKERIMKEPEYSIKFACKLLRDNKKRYSKTKPYWIGIYRSGTALHKPSIVKNAKSYDRIINGTASRLKSLFRSTVANNELILGYNNE